MTNEEYIAKYREEDVRRLALKRAPEGVDLKWCLQQIEGWQLARHKLPRWAATEGLWYPARLSMEQCSSEQTAEYKRQVVERLLPEGERQRMVDLTGGLGVDFAAMAPLFDEAVYVEILPELRRLAEHNMTMLIEKMRSTALRICANNFPLSIVNYQFIYVDPARRDGAGRKTVGIGDCTPNVLEMQDELLANSKMVMVKLSPMLDISEALRQLHNVCEVHVVSVRGECKELLFVMTKGHSTEPTIHCVNLDSDDEIVVWRMANGKWQKDFSFFHSFNFSFFHFLYEPNSSVLKAGVQDVLTERYPVEKLHPQSNLFVSESLIPHFPGRRFKVTGMSDFSKKGLKELIGDLRQANLTIRNFPTNVASLRRQLKLAEGGDTYLFATTMADGSHAMIRCVKP